MVTVRNFALKDLIETNKMVSSFYKEKYPNEVSNTQKILKTVSTFQREEDKGKILIIEDDNKIIGYAIIVLFWSNKNSGDILLIDEMYIKKEYKNNLSLSKCIDYLVSKYNKRIKGFQIELDSMSKDEIDFFSSIGFNMKDNNSYFKKISI